MKTTLRSFQEEAVDRLTKALTRAVDDWKDEESLQAVGLSAPTGSGKTIIATALIEQIIFGGEDNPPDPGATFLWLTDQPELNEQTRDKMMLNASFLASRDRLVVVENTFDAPALSAGKVYFLNTQKLGENAALAQGTSDSRKYSFWETMANTVASEAVRPYVVIDEAHRGMTEGANREIANSILQRFIKGSAVMPPSPIIIGISATPERFNAVLAGAQRHTRPYVIAADAVRASGLIKEHILASHAGERQSDEMALLRVAADAWKDSTNAWREYCLAAREETLVEPALVIQVENEDEASGGVTRTNLVAVINTITDAVGAMEDAAFAHAFQGRGDVVVGNRTIRYLAPSRISDDIDAKVVFFKTSLNQGWDCPRAEVMFSFRKARDLTSIAQLIGRMVRAPLARRIDEDERLNSVDLFLPNYDKVALEQVVALLTESGDGMIADSIVDKAALLTVGRAPGSEEAAEAIETVPSYTVPTSRKKSPVRRLRELTTLLSAHGLDPEASVREKKHLVQVLLDARSRLKDEPEFKEAIADTGEVRIRRVDWAVGAAITSDGTFLNIPVSDENLATLFGSAKRILSSEVAVAYWQARVEEDVTARDTARLEAISFAARDNVKADLETAAKERFDALFVIHGLVIDGLPPHMRSQYDRMKGQSDKPERKAIHLPMIAEFPIGAEDYAKHIFCSEDGAMPLTLNAWEKAVVSQELNDPTIVGWLRNPPRKDWALCVPYPTPSGQKPMYPDFLFLRREGERIVVDIVDPHRPGLEDAANKAKGLASYAQAHGNLLGRIELVAKLDGKFEYLSLQDETNRRKVLEVESPGALTLLFPRTP